MSLIVRMCALYPRGGRDGPQSLEPRTRLLSLTGVKPERVAALEEALGKASAKTRRARFKSFLQGEPVRFPPPCRFRNRNQFGHKTLTLPIVLPATFWL